MKKSTVLALALLVMASCSKENNTPILENSRVAAQFSNGVITRALDNAWEADDQIGVYMVAKGATLTDAATIEDAENIAHTISGAGAQGTFTPASSAETIYFPMDNSVVDFYAYYPYQANIIDGVSKVDVANQSDFSLIDLLASKIVDKSKLAPQVKFNFTHQLSMITMKITAGTGVTESLTGLTVTIEGLSTTADFSLAKNNFANWATTQNILAAVNPTGTMSQAILIPSAAVATARICFELSTNEKFYWSIADKILKSGENVTYEVTLNRGGVVISGSEISPWKPIVGGNVSAE